MNLADWLDATARAKPDDPAVFDGTELHSTYGELARHVRRLAAGLGHAGDIGQLDEDGFLTLTDRAKDLIISGGTNIYPREVEEVLARHPDVPEVSVIVSPSAEWGEDVVAFVVARPGGDCSAEALEAWCRAEMASFKKPKRYVFPAEPPKNGYGKVLKTELRRELADSAVRDGSTVASGVSR